MAITSDLDNIVKWFEEEVCPGILALDMYNDERLAHYIIEYNPDYCDVIVFEGGVQLKLPVVEEAETSETVPPWRATA